MRRSGSILITGNAPVAPGDLILSAPAGSGPLTDFSALAVYASLTGLVGGTLDVWLQTSWDDVLWCDYGHWQQIIAAAAIAHTSIRFARDQQSMNPTVIGFDATPALAGGVFLGGPWGRSMRLLLRAGAGTGGPASAQTVRIFGTGDGPSIH